MLGNVILSVTGRRDDRVVGWLPLYISQCSSHAFNSIAKCLGSGRSALYYEQKVENFSCQFDSLSTVFGKAKLTNSKFRFFEANRVSI